MYLLVFDVYVIDMEPIAGVVFIGMLLIWNP